MNGGDILLCLYILLFILAWLIWPGFFIWGTAVAINSFSKERQARSATPIDGFKRDYKRLITVLKISTVVLAALLALLIYGSMDLSHWLARQWRKRPPRFAAGIASYPASADPKRAVGFITGEVANGVFRLPSSSLSAETSATPCCDA
jgi:hypothetical protein